VTRLRATAALAAALLLPLAACAPPDDGAPRERPSAEATATAEPHDGAPVAGADHSDDGATGDDGGGATDDPGPGPGPAAEDPLGATSVPVESALDLPVDPALGPGVDVTGMELTDELLHVTRTDPSTVGADATAYLFLAAWGDGLMSADGSTVRALSSPGCTFCASVADSTETTPLGPDLQLVTTVWPITVLDPTEDYPYRVVVAGMEHLVGRLGPVGEAVHVEIVSSRRQLLRVGVVWQDGAWSVHGVDADPWDGGDPLTP
jgi:hypothetical protein